jgi:hypothetical protein
MRRTSVTYALAATLALGASGRLARAQRVTSTVDIAGAGLWYADSIRAMGSTVSPAFSIDWPRGTIAASGTLSRLENEGVSAQGTVAPSFFTPSAGPLSGELAGSFGGSSHRDGTHTGQMLGSARAHVMGAGHGGWVGGGLGRTWDGAVWRGVRLAEAGAWLQREGTVALATASPIVVDDSIRYTDLQGSVRYKLNNVELGLTAGARAGKVASALGGTARAWGSASVTSWVHPNVALVASAGSYPVDLTQGFPGGRFATVALRFAARRGRSGEQSVSSPRASSEMAAGLAEAKASGVTQMVVQSAGGNRRTIRVRAPSARSVELNGDFTGWKPLELTRQPDGWWSATLPIEAGTYQMDVRVNGGAWIVPPGLTTVVDEFGSPVGILAIPPG